MSIKQLEGKTIREIKGLEEYNLEVLFICEDGTEFKMHHYQDCCENVAIEEYIGNLENIIGYEVLSASKRTEDRSSELRFGTMLWTFYIIETRRGTLTIRWKGESNGYYSEEVTFENKENYGGVF